MLARRDSWLAPTLPASGLGLPKLMADLFAPFASATPGAVPTTPRVNVREDGEAFVVEAEVPGLARDALTIELEDDTLTLAGTWSTAKATESDDGTVHRAERAHGEFRRQLRFATPLDPEGVTAALADGVLTVRLPKAAEAKPRRIDVQGS